MPRCRAADGPRVADLEAGVRLFGELCVRTVPAPTIPTTTMPAKQAAAPRDALMSTPSSGCPVSEL
jgi:hypothetical protein